MTAAALVVEAEDHAHDLDVIAEDRSCDLAVIASARSADLALAERLWSEFVDHDDVEPRPAWFDHDGPTAAWRGGQERAERIARENAAALADEARRTAQQARHARWQKSTISVGDIDPVKVVELARGAMAWEQGSYAEKVLAVDYSRTVLRRGLRKTARELGLRLRAVERLARHARILRESAA